MSLRLLSLASKVITNNTIVTNTVVPLASFQQVRYRRTKHFNPKWKRLRAEKVIKVELPNFRENFEDMTEEQIRTKYKEKGLLPPRPWIERPMHISATGGVFEAYIPPEGDGKVSPITAQGAMQNLKFLQKKSKTMMAIRKIKAYEEDWDTPEFCKKAQETYIKMHEKMAEGNTEDMTDYVTERAYPEVINNMKGKTIRWRFIKELELPRVVHARYTHMVSEENIFAQLTVRFHTQQSLAIYDRFGRLMHGSEIIAKDVLEYVVFEKHLANEYGVWRIHDKIIPDWMPPREPVQKTFKKLEFPKIEAKDDSKENEKVKEVERAEVPKELSAT